MALSTSLSSKGSIPAQVSKAVGSSTSGPVASIAKALGFSNSAPASSAPHVGVSSPAVIQKAGLLNSSAPQVGVSSPSTLQKAGLLSPSSNVTSHTVTSNPATGQTTTKQTYASPSSSGNSGSSSGNSGTTSGLLPSTSKVQSPYADPSQNLARIEEVSRPSALAQGATQAEALYGMLGNQAKLQPFAGGQTQGLLNSYANLTRPQSTGNLAGETGLFDVQRGILQNAANTVSSQALASQGIQQKGAEDIANLAQPQSNVGFFGSPVTGEVSGQGANLMQNALNNAVQLIQNGASIPDAMSTSGLSSFGLVGQNALTNALSGNGGFNPTAINAIANSNISQGVDYKQVAVDLDTSLKQLDVASELANNFLASNNLLNPVDNPKVNEGINNYIGTFKDPAAVLAYNAILGDIKKFTSTILASNSGTIPTDVSNTLKTFDPSSLSAPQLKPYLQALAQLGNNQKSVIQNQINNLLPNQSNVYAGSPTTINTNPVSTPKSDTSSAGVLGTDNAAGQAAIGGVMGIIGNIGGAISGLASKVLR